MEIITVNSMGEFLDSAEISKLVLENTVCSEILSDVLQSVKENNE